ncbi:MAG TPA: sulfur carrier protein ThiS [Verrucomicrobiae bacterium]|nr:sulfur carrier protein ThiS [Verrucomicrobiae bacterium]
MNPESITIIANGKKEEVGAPCTVANFVTGRGWKATQVVVEYNGRVLSRAELAQIMLKSDDSLEVIMPVAGG